MKILFVVQGEGRGHFTQSIALAEQFQKAGHQICCTLVGLPQNRKIPDFYKKLNISPLFSYNTLSIQYNKGYTQISLSKTILNSLRFILSKQIKKGISTIDNCIKEYQPDLIINFYEPLFGLYSFLRETPCRYITIAHQYMIFSKRSYYSTNFFYSIFLKLFSSLCIGRANEIYALSMYRWSDFSKQNIKTISPLLRSDVTEGVDKVTKGGFILCYILNQGYANDLIDWHNDNSDIEIHAFWDNFSLPSEYRINDKLTFHHIDDKKFLAKMASCDGVITTAGFETICEAAYYNKPILMIPAHPEQEINAKEFSSLGLGIISKNINPSLLLSQIKRESFPRTKECHITELLTDK